MTTPPNVTPHTPVVAVQAGHSRGGDVIEDTLLGLFYSISVLILSLFVIQAGGNCHARGSCVCGGYASALLLQYSFIYLFIFVYLYTTYYVLILILFFAYQFFTC
jgi:hypothetical protein